MLDLRDEPILRCMERSGWPPWMRAEEEGMEGEDRGYGQL